MIVNILGSGLALFGILLGAVLLFFPSLISERQTTPQWTAPTAVIATVVGLGLALSPYGVLGIVLAAGVIAGYTRPSLFSWLALAGLENPFEDKVWMYSIPLPYWVKWVGILALSIVLGVELHPVMTVVIGVLIGWAGLQPEAFDFLGRFNIGKEQKAFLFGLGITLFGAGWVVHSIRFDVILLIAAIGLYSWKYYQSRSLAKERDEQIKAG